MNSEESCEWETINKDGIQLYHTSCDHLFEVKKGLYYRFFGAEDAFCPHCDKDVIVMALSKEQDDKAMNEAISIWGNNGYKARISPYPEIAGFEDGWKAACKWMRSK